MNVYLDESGDLGFNFTAPFRRGGSSRFMTLGFTIAPEPIKSKLRRCVVKTYNKFNLNPSDEVKGSLLTQNQKLFFISQAGTLLAAHPEIKLGCITVYKQRVQPHIINDSNKLYNYMLNLGLLPLIVGETTVNLIRDERSVKVKSGNSLADYLQTQIYFPFASACKLRDYPTDSSKCKNLIFVDWICSCIFNHYEDGEYNIFNRLSPFLSIDKHLYF
ncbi:MAG TPA: hypothetical protein VMV77_03790 [Bacteroidales bacterium]|nr:hypothetical protein [Bacteroidales bacterium]